MEIFLHGERVVGVDVDQTTRCRHWHGDQDIIAIKFRCCATWFPCFECHSETQDHAPETWPIDEFVNLAVLCGPCGHQLTIEEYLACGSACPACAAAFNPGCSKHYHLYFAGR